MNSSPLPIAFHFGPYTLLPQQHQLFRDELPVKLGSRALEILITLVEHAGQLMTKDTLIARAWPRTVVEECNLRTQIAALRRTLSEGDNHDSYVMTVPGQGYRFIFPLHRNQFMPGVYSQSVRHSLSMWRVRFIGRAATAPQIKHALCLHRLAIVGVAELRSNNASRPVQVNVACKLDVDSSKALPEATNGALSRLVSKETPPSWAYGCGHDHLLASTHEQNDPSAHIGHDNASKDALPDSSREQSEGRPSALTDLATIATKLELCGISNSVLPATGTALPKQPSVRGADAPLNFHLETGPDGRHYPESVTPLRHRPPMRVSLMKTLLSTAFATLVAGLSSQASADTPDSIVSRGAYLAKAGDCVACHTAPGGKAFAGGLRMDTPMGAIYSTNITPDKKYGIGTYSEQDFIRAVREGVAQDGHRLYPAMPFPSYAKTSDEDMKALYAYFTSGVEAVPAPNKESEIPWPLSIRWPLAVWSWVFVSNTRYQFDTQQSAEWNRGAYLVQSLGHCGACHTPRGVGFQEKALDQSDDDFLSGAKVEHWFASNLTGNHNTGLGRWSLEDVQTFLRTGANKHATAFGSMTEVIINSTQWLSERDTRAMATYLKSLPGSRKDDGKPYQIATLDTPAASSNHPGKNIYATHCAQCHGSAGRGLAPWLAPLAGNPNVLEPDPSSLINVTLNGTGYLVLKGIPAPFPMPEFHAALSNQEVAAVVTYIKATWSEGAAAVTDAQVAEIRAATSKSR